MVRQELLNDGALIRHYSDDGRYVVQDATGRQYITAVDPYPTEHTYSEGDTLPEDTQPNSGEEAAETDEELY